MLNARLTMDEAKRLAAKCAGGDAETRMWREVYGREPSSSERESAAKFLARQTAELGSAESGLTELARALFNTNEFLYVD